MPEVADWLQEHRPVVRFIFQGGSAARQVAGRAFGVEFPESVCRARVASERSALWLGPEEHLLLAPTENLSRIQVELSTALAGVAHSLVDVSDRQVAYTVTGPDARDVLASGCPLDLDPDAFPVDMCTRTIFGKSEIVLWRRGAEEYHLEMARSFSDYVLGWMREAHRGGSS
ncbi:MAG: sarcosine oxidase subunit gamma [Geminicoccales bacterium]